MAAPAAAPHVPVLIGPLIEAAIARHAIAHERPNVLIELRNDLIGTPAQQAAWAARLAPMLEAAAARAGAGAARG